MSVQEPGWWVGKELENQDYASKFAKDMANKQNAIDSDYTSEFAKEVVRSSAYKPGHTQHKCCNNITVIDEAENQDRFCREDVTDCVGPVQVPK